MLVSFFPEVGGVGNSLPVGDEAMRVAMAIQALPPKDRASLSKIVDALVQQAGDDHADCG
ncbi:MAG TPA: hypothetical protein PKY50_05215 [Candidatus Competibacter sp.]|nr:hypothetical protein [Candidatus Competibacter sp.]